MEYRTLGGSGLKIPALILGTATFGGGSEFLRKWGATDVKEATELVDVALEAGCNMFDTADGYSAGLSEEILGQAIKGRRDQLLIATKTGMPMGPGPNDKGNVARKDHPLVRGEPAAARHRHHRSLPAARVRRADADRGDAARARHADAGGQDPLLRRLELLGLASHEDAGLGRTPRLAEAVTHQVYYSLVARDFEWELMPLGLDQKVGTLVWSPLSGAKLGGKVGRNKTAPEGSRAASDASWEVPEDRLFAVTDVLEALSAETGRSIPQIALAWLLTRPTVSGIVLGARNAEQLRDNLGTSTLELTPEQVSRLDAASAQKPSYPYWHQRRTFLDRNPPPV